MTRKLFWAGELLLLLLAYASTSSAQAFYVASEPGQQLDYVDFGTPSVTNIHSIPGKPDSVVVDASGRLIYSVPSNGSNSLQMFDPSTGKNTVLWTFGYPSSPRDMVFDPSGKTLLIALYTGARLARYDLTNHSMTIFPAKPIGSSLDGLAYDPAGNLFAVVSHNLLCQLDPNSGQILQSLTLEPHVGVNGGDGLVYDPHTKNLWMAHDGTIGNGLIEVPLTESKPPRLGTPIFLQTGKIHVPDEVISDGQGNLYIGEGLQFLTKYNIDTDTVVKRMKSPGIDGMAFVPLPAGQAAHH